MSMTLAVAEAYADTHQRPSQRAVEMGLLYSRGLTLQEIADQYGVSRQRVYQIIEPFGLTSHYGKRKQDERVRRLTEACARIRTGDSTSSEEAERLGYASAGTLRGALNELGLRLREEWQAADHGTVRRYRQGCKCDECRRAHREDLYASRQNHVITEHGLATNYVNYGCRCPGCKEAVRIQRRDAKARRRQALTTD